MDTRKHVAIRQETHAMLKNYCTDRFMNIGAFIDNLIRKALKESEATDVKATLDKPVK